MNNNLSNIHLASTIVATYYEKLKKLSSESKEDTLEFKEIVIKLRNAIIGENNIYEYLTSEDVKEIDKYFKVSEPYNMTEARIYAKIGNFKRLHNKKAIIIDKDILLSSVITSKLIIDVLKLVKLKISSLPDDEKEIINIYNNNIKYTYLSSNNFIERIANEYNYNIDAMPTINFYSIEKNTNIKFMAYSQDIFLKYITDSMAILDSSDETDEYLNKYDYLFELSRIEIMIPYLNRQNLEKIKKGLCNLQNNQAIIDIKKLVMQKEKDFE